MMRNRQPISIVLCVVCIGRSITAIANAAESKVEITSAHTLSINGNQVFPIMMSVIPEPGAKAPNGKSAWKEFRDAGAILIRTTPPPNADGDSRRWNDDAVRRQAAYLE